MVGPEDPDDQDHGRSFSSMDKMVGHRLRARTRPAQDAAGGTSGPLRQNGRAMSKIQAQPEPPTLTTLQAALWDFDGTLADTEPLWIDAEFELIGQLGGKLVDRARRAAGRQLPARLRRLHPQRHRPARPEPGLDGRPVDHTTWYASSARLRCPGGRAPSSCSTRSASAGIPCALVSASYRVLLDAALARLPVDTFQVLGGRRRGRPRQAAPRAV